MFMVANTRLPSGSMFNLDMQLNKISYFSQSIYTVEFSSFRCWLILKKILDSSGIFYSNFDSFKSFIYFTRTTRRNCFVVHFVLSCFIIAYRWFFQVWANIEGNIRFFSDFLLKFRFLINYIFYQNGHKELFVVYFVF